MAYEALYRRYRPSRFEDAFFGQAHVVAALRNAVENDRVGHAYLFSGPRGTGKTTSARILAKALNCTNLQAGEPCDECDSCLAFNSGSSYDLHELDAASNNGVDAMRDLIAKVALGSPGRTKVYILDEVHMLSSGAENALLKTLEEPPPHVVFVLCTTEPNKVVPTIRSRTQHLEFSLLAQAEVNELIEHVAGDAGIDLSDEDRAYVARAGGGSARDTLSALDQVVAAGGAPRGGEHLEALMQALIDRESGAALAAIDGAVQAGRDPAGIATVLLGELRGVFLARMSADISHLPDVERQRIEHYAGSMPPARVTRSIEVLGSAIIDMRQAPDPRVDLEVAVLRLTRADLDVAPEALLERIEALEAGAPAAAPASPAPVPAAAAPGPAPVPAASAPSAAPDPGVSSEPSADPASTSVESPAAAAPTAGKRGADMARAKLAELRGESGTSGASPEPVAASAPAEAAPPPPAVAPVADEPPRTLADRRRQRQQSAAAGAPAAPGPVPVADAPIETVEPRSEPVPAAPADPASAVEPVPAAPADPASAVEPVPAAPADPAEVRAASVSPLPSLGQLQAAWQGLLESMSGRVRSRFSAGRFLEPEGGTAQFGLPNPVHRDRCEEVRAEVDDALAAHFGASVPLALVVDNAEIEPDIFATASAGAANDEPPALDHDDEAVDLDALTDADDAQVALSGVDRVLATFEGSTVVEDPSNPPDDQG